MRLRSLWTAAASALLALLLASCGGGGSLLAEGGIGGTGISMGKVTAFGSVFVNGVEYETSQASILIDGQSVGEDSLGVGMVVKVTGTVNADGLTGTASGVEYADLIEGRVDSNEVSTSGTLTVMGQTVIAGVDVVYARGDCTNIAALADVPAGASVEVSGFSDGSGLVYASRIECKQASWSGTEIELKGVALNVDTNARTLIVGTLAVDWNNASLADGVPENGWYVQIKGSSFDNSVFVATSIEKTGGGDTLVGDDGDEVELEGVVTTGLTGNQFTLNGQPVQVSSSTEYEHGAVGDIATGVNLKAEGAVSGGVLLAGNIEFKAEDVDKHEFEGNVTAIDTANSSFVVSGQTIRVDNNTIWEDERDNLRYFSLSDLSVGDQVSVHAYDDGSGWLATKVERED